MWEDELEADEDKLYIFNGLKYGFRLTDADQDIKSVEYSNYVSATRPDRVQLVESQLKEEIKMGHFIQTSKKPTIVNAIGAVPKDNSDELRLITDASRPTGSSLNSYMSLESFKFDTVDTAISLLSKDFYQCKLDLRHGYRSVPIHPDDYPLCGLKWYFDGSAHPTYLMDTRLCFGAAKAPQIFQRLTSAITRMMRRRGYSACICYLDDFYMCAASYEDAMAAYECLQELLTSLGFRINRKKSVPPIANFPGH